LVNQSVAGFCETTPQIQRVPSKLVVTQQPVNGARASRAHRSLSTKRFL